MKPIRSARGMAWSHEFELVDEEVQAMRAGRERAKRSAMLQNGLGHPSPTRPTFNEMPQLLASMSTVPLTRHAEHRMKNRGIRLDQVMVVATFGQSQPSHGATRYALDRRSRQLLAKTLPADQLRRLGSLDIVAVFADDGALITAAHRTQRVRND